jgi:flagellar hook-associated protein 1 FlgK
VNQLARTIATLNGEIASAEVGPHEAPDLRDQRDRAIDRLSKLGDVRVFNHPDGTAQITLGNNLLVDRTNARELVVAVQSMIDAADPTTGIAFADMPSRRLLPVGGQVSALVRSINDGVRRTRTDLDRLANGLARVVNQVVAHGETAVTRDTPPLFVSNLDGTFDRDADPFAAERFALDPTLPRPSAGTVTARTISLNQAYLDTPGLLPTSSSADRVTDNDVALAMAMLRDRASVTVGSVSAEFDLIDLTKQQQPTWASGPSLGEFYRGLASTLGATTRTAATEKTVRETLASQADARRQAVSGVNLDEELTTLMRAQQAYQAAAKVISAADEMLKVLTSMI